MGFLSPESTKTIMGKYLYRRGYEYEYRMGKTRSSLDDMGVIWRGLFLCQEHLRWVREELTGYACCMFLNNIHTLQHWYKVKRGGWVHN